MLDWLRHWASTPGRWRHAPLVLVMAASLLTGWWVAGDYGEAWDEPVEVRIGQTAARAYLGVSHYDGEWLGDYYGPSYDMLSLAGAKVLAVVRPGWPPLAARHFNNFLAFQLAVFSLYAICIRFASKAASLGATLLFVTQPVLFGHAFINPKDIPFMAFFLATVAAGLAMSAAFDARPGDGATEKEAQPGWWASLVADWQSKDIAYRVIVAGMVAVEIILAVDILFFGRILDRGVQDVVRDAYNGDSWGPVNWWFAQISGTPPAHAASYYTQRWAALYGQGLRVSMLCLLLVPGAVTLTRLFDTTTKRLLSPRAHRWLVLGGVLLGLTTSIRIFGPFAGALVSGLLLYERRAKAILPLVVYWGLAALVTFITWPFLWDAPLARFWQTVQVMRAFPWVGLVLYRGATFTSTELPRAFLPHMMTLQLTATGMAAMALGLVVSLRRARAGSLDGASLVLMLAWLVLPLGALVALGVPVYDNFRHFLYVLPPLFILAGVGLDALFGALRSRALQVAVAAIVLLPGVVGIVRLHPYEYTYYNALTGGVAGAFRRYELDYWCTSYREAMAYVNEVAAPEAEIAVWGPQFWAEKFARDDLDVYWVSNTVEPGWTDPRDPAYAVLCARANVDRWLYGDSEVVWQVERQDAVFTTVKKVN